MSGHYKDLVAWQKAMKLVIDIYRVTHGFPKDELYGLTAQLRRAVVSIPSNIAEGQARFSHREFLRSLATARGSLAEVETQILIAKDLAYIGDGHATELLTASGELGRILTGLRDSIRRRAESAPN